MSRKPWRDWFAAGALALTMTVGQASVGADTRVRFLALGDSYTIGEGVAPQARWTHQLAAALRKRGVALDDPVTIARTGWTTDELATAIDAAAPTHDYALVTLLIGVNNQYRGRDASEYAAQFDALLKQAISFAHGRPQRVLVLSTPDWGATRFGRNGGRDLAQVSREIDTFNSHARDICERRGVAFIDITTDSRAHAGPEMEADDGLHPSAALYARWAQHALPAAQHALQVAQAIDAP